MIALFVKRPVTTTIFIAMLTVLGLVSVGNLNVEENPKVDFPLLTIKTIYPGATPLEVEAQVIRKIEDAVSEVAEIEKINSKAYDGYGLVLVEFSLNSDVNTKFIEVKDKVDAILMNLPTGSEKPIIEKFDPLAKSVVDLVITSKKHSLVELYSVMDKKVKPKFSAIDGVAKVILSGGKQRQINVLLDPSLMKKYFITIDEAVDAIQRKNINAPGGSIEMQGISVGVRFIGEYQTVDEIAGTEIYTPEGERITLKQIAVIEDGFDRVESKSRYNSLEVVSMSIINVSDGNPVKVASRIRSALPAVQETLPDGMELKVVTDNTDIIVYQTNDTVLNIIMGIGLTIFILFVFTGNWRVTIISSIVIPSSIISSFFLMDVSNFSINQMSLLAVATSLGTLIANAIVIIENVIVHLNMGKDSQTAAIEGTREVVVPVIASVGTNLVVFTPIAFMGGIVGKFMLEFGMTVVFATIFSLIASLSLTPMLCGLLFSGGYSEDQKSSFAKSIDRVQAWVLSQYRIIFDVMFKYPLIWLVVMLIIIISSFKLAGQLGNEFTPDYDKNKVVVEMTLPPGQVIEVTEDRVKRVEAIAKSIPEVINIYSKLGASGTETATVELELRPLKQRKKSDLDIIQEIIPKLAMVPDVQFGLNRGDSKGGATPDIEVNIYGQSYDDMVLYSEKMQKIMVETGFFQSVDSSWKNSKPELKFIPDQEKLANFGIPNAIIGRNLRTSVYGDESNVFKKDGEEYPINVRLRDAYRVFPTDIGEVTVKTRKGIIPIDYLGEVKMDDAIPNIDRRNKERVIKISGYLVKSTAGVVQKNLEKQFLSIDFKPSDGFRFVGDSETQEESQREIAKAFSLATLMTFMILAAILNSWIHPLTITLSIVNAFAGVFIALFIGEYSINIASLLALVMLVGLVVNNEIILLDEALSYIKKGLSIKDGLWQAIQSKFRVITMTSLAVVFGALPQLGSFMTTKSSMGGVIIGGNIASLIFAFLLTPVIFYFMERLRQFGSQFLKPSR